MTSSQSPRFLYLHGFGSSPESTKARAMAGHFARRGVDIERLDLRKPSFESMRISAMIAHVRERIGDAHDRAVLIGSSLGGLTALRVAEQDARVGALVLMAPAFRMAERWRARVGEEKFARYRDDGFIEADDYLEKRKRNVDFGFYEDLAAVDAGGGGWPDVRVPTLIVHGIRDDVVSVDVSREWARGKRHVRMIEVDDGHELTTSLGRIIGETDAFLAAYMNS